MNIHRPPPRRNTLDRTLLDRVKPNSRKLPPGYASPKTNAALASHFDSDVYVDPAEEIYAVPPEDEDEELYAIPPELDDDEINAPNYSVPRPVEELTNGLNGGFNQVTDSVTQKRNSQDGPDGVTSPRKSNDGGKVGVRTTPGGVKTDAASTANSFTSSSSSKSGESLSDSQPAAGGVTKPKPSIYDDTVFENDPSKQTENRTTATAVEDDDAVYENTDFDHVEISKPPMLLKKAPIATTNLIQSPTRHKPKKHTPDDYEDLEYFEGKSPTELIPAMDDYVDMDGTEHNTYVATEELQRRGSDLNDTPVASPRLPVSPVASAIPAPQGMYAWYKYTLLVS